MEQHQTRRERGGGPARRSAWIDREEPPWVDRDVDTLEVWIIYRAADGAFGLSTQRRVAE
jgi:hypothetical protein